MATKAQLAQAAKDIAALRAKRAAASAPKARTARAAAHAKKVQPEAQHASIEELMADIALPSPTRVIVAAILGLAAAGAVGYGISLVMAYALAGIMTLTGSAALAFALSAAVWVLGIYATWKIGGYVGGKVFSSVVLPDGLASRCYESLAGAVRGVKSAASDTWNEVDAVQRVKKFSGAYTKPVAA